MLAQGRRALDYLHRSNVTGRASALWAMGFGHYLLGDRAAAHQAHSQAVSISQAAGAIFTTILATIGLGNVLEADNQLPLAAETYRRVLQLSGDQPLQIVHEAQLGLARIYYEWNDLEAAERHGRQSLVLARQYESHIDRFLLCEMFLARLKLAQGDVDGAAAILAQANQAARQQSFAHRLPEVAAAQVQTLLRQGRLAAAAHLAQQHDLPLTRARVHLARGDPAAALAALEPWRLKVQANDWKDEQLRVLVLQALALQAQGDREQAVQQLAAALALAEPGGFIRTFVDEGGPMAQLLSAAATRGMLPDYVARLLAALVAEQLKREGAATGPPAQESIEPLSPRELEVLRLMAQGLSNGEISERLFLALSTVKGHNQRIFEKLQVQRRTEAIARARDWGLL
jgi:LuxR family maltose regulon positive regulatory protein